MQQLQIPPLAEGELYIGCIGDAAGTHHNALADACHQALHLQRVMARLHQLDVAEAA